VYFEVAPYPGMVTFGSGVYLDELVALAGGQNCFAQERGWFSPSAEAVLAANPQVIFLMSDSGAAEQAAFASRPGFASISAVQKGRLYPIDADSASRPSARVTTALSQMAAALRAVREGGAP
jgi:iron complex transport system substrate-binding protein